MRLRRLTELGIEQFEGYLDSLGTDQPQTFPDELLADGQTTDAVTPKTELEAREFANRFELAEYLHDRFSESGLAASDRDLGLWAWIGLFYFEQLCPPDQAGKRKPGERARWIPAIGDFRKYYRHLVVGPFRIYQAHREKPESARAVLCTRPSQPGEIVEQLTARQELVTNQSIMEVATALYVDPKTQRPKRGAASKGAGSARRLAEVLSQFDLTWDLYSMRVNDLLELLPAEFDRFVPPNVADGSEQRR